jgi:hypothetical protein
MWNVTVVCSDDKCAEVMEVVVDDLDDVDAVVCDCEHSVVVLAVASFVPLSSAA